MKLELSTWLEVEDYLKRASGLMIPVGSHEQHGPIGLIGTDALCAQAIAEEAARTANCLVAPPLFYTPAPFNLAFPGTVSIREETFEALLHDMLDGLIQQGFDHFYFLNGHGANLAPLKRIEEEFSSQSKCATRIRSWWDFDAVNALRSEYYGDWEGMHATPSEVAITQATHRVVESDLAAMPPRRLTPEYIRDHAGDRHGPADEHRRDFPDGRVGSHSALARPEHGAALLHAAAGAVAMDYQDWTTGDA